VLKEFSLQVRDLERLEVPLTDPEDLEVPIGTGVTLDSAVFEEVLGTDDQGWHRFQPGDYLSC
jgi:hypothetical protein